MLNALKQELEKAEDRCEVRNIMCNFFSHNKPQLINDSLVVGYAIYNDRIEIDTHRRFESFTTEDVTNAVIVGESILQVPNPRRLYNQIVTLTF